MTNSGNGAVGVVIVNWNSWSLSLACLASLRTTVGADWHLFLIDNASTDDSRAHLTDLGEDVTVLLSDTNGGWTGGNNLGVRAALAAGYEHIFVLNNDAQVMPDTIRQLLRYADAHSVRPIVGPVHRDEDRHRLNFVGTTYNLHNGLSDFVDSSSSFFAGLPAAYPTSFIKGAAILAHHTHFADCGLFDDRYYLNCDEMDWCYRVREKGYPVMMLKDAEIIHDGSASIGGAQSPLGIYFLTRNSLLFSELHGSARQRVFQSIATLRWLITLSERPTRLSRLIWLAVGRSRHAVAARRGIQDYVLRRFGNCPPEIRQLSGSR